MPPQAGPPEAAPAQTPPPGAPPLPTAQPATPGYYAPPAGAYVAPAGGYQQYPGAYGRPAAPAGAKGLGTVALILALAALIIPTIIAAVTGYTIGAELGERGIETLGRTSDLSMLTKVRDSVLWAEIAFWLGTALGIWAIVQGFIAIGKRRGRGAGIAAVIIAFVAPGFYFFTLFLVMGIGAAVSDLAL